MSGRGGYWRGYPGARPRTSTFTLPVAPGPHMDVVQVPPMQGLSLKILEDQKNSRVGTITHINNSKQIGYIKPRDPLPSGYNSSSVFFHFNVIKNTSNYTTTMTKGTNIKFILYEAKDGNTDNLSKPKAFSVYTYDQTENSQHCKRANMDERQEVRENETNKNRKSDEVKQCENYANYKRVKKVSVFWDIENCRPQRGKVLDIVQQVRHLSHIEGYQEQTFMAVCDVTKERKDLIRDLESANVNVMNRSRKKNSSDEILRQQMRKVVDTSEDPGRIILISGDSDFSTDLHSFRYVKMYETFLIYSDKTTSALIKIATRAIPFNQINQNLVVKDDGVVPSRKNKKSKPKTKHPSNHSGWTMLPPDSSGWFCADSKNPHGCWRGLLEKSVNEGKTTSDKFSSFICKDCPYRICDLCKERTFEK